MLCPVGGLLGISNKWGNLCVGAGQLDHKFEKDDGRAQERQRAAHEGRDRHDSNSGGASPRVIHRMFYITSSDGLEVSGEGNAKKKRSLTFAFLSPKVPVANNCKGRRAHGSDQTAKGSPRLPGGI